MKPLLPPLLKPGDTVGVISPASPPIEWERVERGILYLEQKGFRVKRGKNLHATDGYLNGSDEKRAADLHAMFADQEIAAIFSTRGGYGSSRLLDKLDYDLIRANPKPLTGFSDLTALCMALYAKTGLITFGGPMVAVEMQKQMDPDTEYWLWAALMEGRTEDLTIPADEGGRSIMGGKAEGPLLGGNLSVLVTLLGTSYAPQWEGGILLVEDVGEASYRIDRMLCHLKNAGVLGQLSGVVLGDFSEIPEERQPRSLETIFDEYFLPLGVPVCTGFPFGHATRKATLPFGATVRLDAAHRLLTIPPLV